MSAAPGRIETVPPPRAVPGWKHAAAAACAIILSLLCLASGVWKLSDLDATSERMVQSLVPVALSTPAALAVAICEAFAGVLLLIPRYRRWGAWIAALMLAAFMIYIGVLYDRLLGEDCNCFPWIRRVVGPAFFAGDAAMLFVVATVPDHFLEEHLWRHVAQKHAPRVFLWTLAALLLSGPIERFFQLSGAGHECNRLLLLLACSIGLIPESGPHLIFVTLYAQHAVPFGVLLASSIVQDGHGMLPMLAHSRQAFFTVKAVNFHLGFAAGGIALSLYP
jgi:hypothetical protein